jgi:hypothetical protein
VLVVPYQKALKAARSYSKGSSRGGGGNEDDADDESAEAEEPLSRIGPVEAAALCRTAPKARSNTEGRDAVERARRRAALLPINCKV